MANRKSFNSVHFFIFLSVFLFSLYTTGCKTLNLSAPQPLLTEKYTDPQVLSCEVLVPQNIEWQEIEPGFEMTKQIIFEHNIQWACVKINLKNPDLVINATPAKNELRQIFSHKDFAKTSDSIVAINTVPFDLDGKSYIPVSIVKINNEEIIPPVSGYCALCLKKKQNETFRAVIIDSQNQDEILNTSEYAFGGFSQILKDNQIFEFEKFKRSRTAAGTNSDGTELYLFAACGISSPTGRSGLNFEECAAILKELGCTDAMEFDGGHSTGLVVKNRNIIHPMLQRKVPALLGFSLKK